MSDLAPLLSADVGIVISQNKLLRRVAASAGIQLRPLLCGNSLSFINPNLKPASLSPTVVLPLCHDTRSPSSRNFESSAAAGHAHLNCVLQRPPQAWQSKALCTKQRTGQLLRHTCLGLLLQISLHRYLQHLAQPIPVPEHAVSRICSQAEKGPLRRPPPGLLIIHPDISHALSFQVVLGLS